MPPRKKAKVVESEDEKSEASDKEEEDEKSSDSGSDSGSESDGEGEGEEGNGEAEDNDNSDSESSESSDEDKEEEELPKKRKRTPVLKASPPPAKKKATKASAASKKAVKKVTKSSSKSSSKSKVKDEGETKVRQLKGLRKTERLEEARKAYKWWEAPKLPSGINWRYLEHAGIKFAPAYERHNVPLLYEGKPVPLTAEQEEVATFYAAMPLDGPQLGNEKTRRVFQKNFFEDFQEVLGSAHTVQVFAKCDFSQISKHLDMQKSLRKAATDDEKTTKRLDKEVDMLKHGYALIDGRVEKMGNFSMEPPGLFRGRGEHPKTGKLKTRCYAEQVSLNLSEDCAPPIAPPGHAWASIRHDPGVTWLAGWNENVQSQNKYIMLAASSSFKGKSDQDKYTKAIRLKGCIHKVRADYICKIKSKDISEQQLGVAMWVIDILALRVGGEKGDDEADTVGCCSLRCEHITFNPDDSVQEIDLEFLGKDSMLFKQTISLAAHGDLGKQVYHCLKAFVKGKKHDQDVFDTLTPPILNKHLNSLMKGLTAKVFRTYNASVTLEKELPSAEDLQDLSMQEKVVRYNAANRQVAILCNHQRTVSKAAETMFENLNERLQILKDQRVEMTKWKDLVEHRKAAQVPLKEDDAEVIEAITAAITAATARKESARSNADKLSAAEALEAAKKALKDDQRRRNMEKHKFKQTPSAESLANRIEKWTEDIRKLEVDIRNRDENKEVALGTSKINYMDPRISVAWCKRCEVPIDKVFAKTLRDKFNWAMVVPPEWKFE